MEVDGAALHKAEQRAWVDFKNLELYGPPGRPTPAVPAAPALSPPAVPPPALIRRTRGLVRRIKAHPNYTAAIGADLGVVGAARVAARVVKPDGKAEALPGHEVRISFVKSRHAGVDVESRRADESAWTHLAFDGFSPYVDNRPPLVAGRPELRRYRLRYRDKDQPVGEYSDVYVVTTNA